MVSAPDLSNLKEWQPALGTAFGFVALILGALFNAHLNRRRDDRLRKEDTAAIAAALYGEILQLRDHLGRVARSTARVFLQEGMQGIRGFDQHFLESHPLPDPTVYPALAIKLGLLPPATTIAVIRFHENYRTVRAWLPMMLPKDGRKFNYSALYVLEPAMEGVRSIIPILRDMERLIGLPEAELDIDTGEATTVIGMETELFANDDE